jgi:hypothetical protein
MLPLESPLSTRSSRSSFALGMRPAAPQQPLAYLDRKGQ